MTNIKATKRALGSSVLALFLCFAMLLGTTFAWFTDSVTSNNNIITAGNLDVELYYQVEGQTDWTKVTDTTNIFKEDTLWEPGHTEVVKLKVVNAGTLDFKYQLGVNIAGETGATNKYGDPFMLSDYIKYGVLEGEKDFTREGAVTAVESTATKLNVAYNSGAIKLAAGTDKIVTMVVYMPVNVGNEANHTGTAPTINLGINVFATQVSSESDSFGSDYDDDAIFYDKLVTTNDELKAAIEATDVKVIAIDGDLTYNWGVDSYKNSKALLMKGKVLRGYNVDASITFAGYGSANPITDVTLMDITVNDETVGDNEGAWEHGHLEFVSLKATNVTFAKSIMLDGDSTLKDCSMDNTVESWYGLWIEGGNTVLKNCTFTGTRAVKIHEAYGSKVESVVIDNCTFVELSEKPGVVIGDVDANTNIAIKNSKFIGTQPGDKGKYFYETDTDVTTFVFTYENNIIPDATTNSGLYKDKNGVYYATTSEGFVSGVETLNDEEKLVVYSDVTCGSTQLTIDKKINIDLNGNTLTTSNNYGGMTMSGGASIKNGTISHTGNTAAIKVLAKAGAIEDITINMITTPGKIKTGIQLYNGKHIDTIRNVTIIGATQGIEVANGSSVDLIENVKTEATKKGLQVQQSTVNTINNSIFYGEECGVWAQLKGTNDLNLNFVNCAISGGKYGIYMCDEGATPVSGVAKLSYDEATTFEGGVKDKEFVFGQLENGKLVINGKTVAMFISTAEELFAFANKVNVDKNTFSGKTVLLTADIDLENKAWTPIGQTGATQFMGTFDGQGYTIKNMTIKNTDTSANCASGFFGWLNNATVKNVTIENATVTGNHNVAVIAGYMETSGCTISNCHVIGATVVAKHANDDACGDKVGVIVGHAGNAGVKVEKCTAKNCTVKAGRDAGQIAGAALTANVTGCTATDVEVTAGGDCTGANIKNEIIGRVLG